MGLASKCKIEFIIVSSNHYFRWHIEYFSLNLFISFIYLFIFFLFFAFDSSILKINIYFTIQNRPKLISIFHFFFFFSLGLLVVA